MSYRRPLYERRIEQKNGRCAYIVTVLFGGGKLREVVVSEDVYNAVGQLARQDRRLSLQDERHSEYRELSDESLYERAFLKPKAIEDAVTDRLMARQALAAIKSLTPVQARRFILRNVVGLTYPEIAKIEGCGAQSAKDSVEIATKKVRKLLNL